MGLRMNTRPISDWWWHASGRRRWRRRKRLAAYQVDQASQDEMNARNRWVSARTDYALQLDRFKVNLGLPTELNIQPDSRELEQLQGTRMIELKYDMAQAEPLAEAQRLDLKNAREQVADADRKVLIAENALLPGLDVSVNYAMADKGHNQPFNLDTRTRAYSGGLNLELPLDRKLQRNAYCEALIARDQAARNADQLRNEILVQVRQAWQHVAEARLSYDIQEKSLQLASKRVDQRADAVGGRTRRGKHPRPA